MTTTALYNSRDLNKFLKSTFPTSDTKTLIATALRSAGLYPGYKSDPPLLTVQIDNGAGGSIATDQSGELLIETGSPTGQVTVTSDGGNVIAAGDGTDFLFVKQTGAAAHGDTLIGGAGHETLKVVTGNNLLKGGMGPDTLFGGKGNDTLYGGGAGSVLHAGTHASGTGGSTLYSGAAGGDSLYGGGGHDRLVAQGGSNYLKAGSGLDTLYGSKTGVDTLVGGGQSVLHAGKQGSVLQTSHLTTGHDTLFGSASASGHDTLTAFAGDNVLKAGAGSDTLFGGSGHDTLYGGKAASANTEIHTGSGDGQLVFGAIKASQGHTTVYVSAQGNNDTIKGGVNTTVNLENKGTATSGTFTDSKGVNYVTVTFSQGGHDTQTVYIQASVGHINQ